MRVYINNWRLKCKKINLIHIIMEKEQREESIYLYSRGDRLGSHLIQYISI